VEEMDSQVIYIDMRKNYITTPPDAQTPSKNLKERARVDILKAIIFSI
jgi:hypothetical protein